MAHHGDPLNHRQPLCRGWAVVQVGWRGAPMTRAVETAEGRSHGVGVRLTFA